MPEKYDLTSEGYNRTRTLIGRLTLTGFEAATIKYLRTRTSPATFEEIRSGVNPLGVYTGYEEELHKSIDRLVGSSLIRKQQESPAQT